jgi:hypothetical protein
LDSASGLKLPQKTAGNGVVCFNVAHGIISGVRVTHPDKVLYPEGGYTKRDLASYYQDVAKFLGARQTSACELRPPSAAAKERAVMKLEGRLEGAPELANEPRPLAWWGWGVRGRRALQSDRHRQHYGKIDSEKGGMKLLVYATQLQALERPALRTKIMDYWSGPGLAKVLYPLQDFDNRAMLRMALYCYARRLYGPGVTVNGPLSRARGLRYEIATATNSV